MKNNSFRILLLAMLAIITSSFSNPKQSKITYKIDTPKKKLQYLIDNHSENLKKQIEDNMIKQFKRVMINHSNIELTTTLNNSTNTMVINNRM